jgi:hypothetical protein
MNGIGAHTGQTYIQTFIFIYIDETAVSVSERLQVKLYELGGADCRRGSIEKYMQILSLKYLKARSDL